MKTIRLSNSNKKFKVDDDDYEKVLGSTWRINNRGYPQAVRCGRTIMVHRLIMNFPADKTIDHINLDKLDNRKENLRICTLTQNLRNCSKRACNTSGYKGVSWKKTSKKYRATINVDKKHIHIGYFTSPLDAAKAYDEQAIKYFGEYARINFEMPNS